MIIMKKTQPSKLSSTCLIHCVGLQWCLDNSSLLTSVKFFFFLFTWKGKINWIELKWMWNWSQWNFDPIEYCTSIEDDFFFFFRLKIIEWPQCNSARVSMHLWMKKKKIRNVMSIMMAAEQKKITLQITSIQ